MIQKEFLYREKNVDVIIQHLFLKIKEYDLKISVDEKTKIKNAIYFLEKKSPKTFYKRVCISNTLLKIRPDIFTLLASFFIPLGNQKFSSDEIKKYAGYESFYLLQGVEKVSGIVYQGEKNAGIVRRYLLSEVEDVRVIYLRVSKRIGLLQKIFHNDLILSEKKKERYVKGAFYISVPILAELGIYELKTFLEDICFGILFPIQYQELKRNLDKTKKIREKNIQYIKKELGNIFKKRNIPIIQIKGRNKGLYSIFEKINRKKYSSYEEVMDMVAIRIIVKNTEDCYAVLSELHSHREFLESHFKDYIISPKLNGYQSIHTTLVGLLEDNIPVEIQIRTEKMDHNAEIGYASHWKYKGGESISSSYVKSDDYTNNIDRFELLKKSLPKKIYPITPTGEIKELPVNATPVDFAYYIHSDIGDHCSGALVNGKISPLSSSLKTGDIVEILTNSHKKPNPDWLYFVKSASARHKIQAFIKREYKKNILETDKKRRKELEKIENTEYEVSSQTNTDVYLGEKENREDLSVLSCDVIIGGEKNIPHRFAKCCHPEEMLDDDIVAYASSARNFVIHSAYCRNIKNLDKNRCIDAYWDRKNK